MPFTRFTASLSILSTAATLSVVATAMTPGQLMHECQQQSPAASHFCDGYIAGAVDAGRSSGQLACVPDDISSATLSELAMNTLRENTDSTGDASSLISERLADIFPCSDQKETDSNPAEQTDKKNWSNKERLR
jgi:hypothetical protein